MNTSIAVLTTFAIIAGITLLRTQRRKRSHNVQGKPEEVMSTRTLVGWNLALLLPPAIYFLAINTQLSTQASIFAALLSATVLLWIFRLVDEYVGPLVALIGTLFVGLAPPSVALSGFASPSMLLLVGVFALSAAISSSGLSYRVIMTILMKVPDNQSWRQLALLVAGYGLSPIVPSANARLSLLTPVYKDMAIGLRLQRKSPEITALLSAMLGGACLLSPMLATSKSANIASLSFLPQQLQNEFNGLFWLVAAGSAAATVTAFHLLSIHFLNNSTTKAILPKPDIQQKLADMGDMNPEEWTATLCFLFFLVGSATVSWHHVRPPYLAGCVLLGLLLTGTLRRKDFRSQLDWPQIFFLLGLDSMVKIMDYLGIQEAIARLAAPYFGMIQGDISLFLLSSLIVTLAIRLVLPVTAGALMSAVILLPIASEQNINPWICIFCAAIFSDIAFFRYQGTNGQLQLHSDGISQEVNSNSFAKYIMIMNVARVAAVFCSIPWWRQLGLL